MSLSEVTVLTTVPKCDEAAELEVKNLPKKTGVPKKSSLPDKPRLYKSSMSGNTDYVYVNSAFVGSVNSVNHSVNQSPNNVVVAEPPTSVIREQYWACSKWPQAQKILAITVGVLVGTVIALSVWLVILEFKDDAISFFSS